MVLATRQGGLATPAAAHPFKDDKIVTVDDLDPTKKIRFEVGGIATGTTRVVTFPDSDITLGNGMGLALADVEADVDFTAEASKDFEFTLAKEHGVVARARAFIDADPGAAFSDVPQISLYAKPTRLGADLIGRWAMPLVYTELSVATSVGSPNLTVDDESDFSPDDPIIVDPAGSPEEHVLKTVGVPMVADDNFAAIHAIDKGVVTALVMDMNSFYGDASKKIYGRMVFPGAVTVSTKVQLKVLT